MIATYRLYVVFFTIVVLCLSCTDKKNLALPTVPPGATINMQTLTAEDEKAYKRYRDRSFFTINNFFINVPSPYAATISSSITCPDKFKPTYFDYSSEIEIKDGVDLYAGKRGEFGICDETQVHSRTLLTFIHCKKLKTTYEIKISFPAIAPLDLKNVFSQIHCTGS